MSGDWIGPEHDVAAPARDHPTDPSIERRAGSRLPGIATMVAAVALLAPSAFHADTTTGDEPAVVSTGATSSGSGRF